MIYLEYLEFALKRYCLFSFAMLEDFVLHKLGKIGCIMQFILTKAYLMIKEFSDKISITKKRQVCSITHS